MIDVMTPKKMRNSPAPASLLPAPLRRRAERFGLPLPPAEAGEEAVIALAVELFFRPLRWPVPTRELAWRERGEGFALEGGGFVRLWDPPAGVKAPTEGRIVLAHGWEGRATQLAAIAEDFLAAGWPVAAVDAPAHGEAPGETASMPRYAANLLEAAGRIGPIAAFIGHSFGGAAGLLALGRGMAARCAAIIAAPSDITGLGTRFAAGVRLNPTQTQTFLAAAEARAGHRLADLDTPRMAATFSLPGLILHDPADRYVAYAESETLAAAWPGAILEPTPGMGHLDILTAPTIRGRILGFVATAE